MDLLKQLGVAHSRANADLILNWLEQDRARTRVLMEVVRSKNPEQFKLVQRAAMVLGDLGRKHPDWLLPYHSELIELARESTHPAIPRAVTRYFSELPLAKVEESNQGHLLDMSFDYLTNPEASVTMKVFSMSTLLHFTRLFPELRDELRGLIELQLEEGENSAGYISRARKVLRELSKGR